MSVSRLKNSYQTYAEDLKNAGYATGFFGKWHLGFDPYIPENQGFDTVVGGGGYPGPRSFFSPYNMPEVPDGPAGEHIDDRMVAEAIKFMDEAASDGKPFLVNFWSWDVHAPFQGKDDLIAKYQAKLDANPNLKQKSPTMGAMVETLDQNVGQLMAHVEELGLTDDTLVVFFSDNGGNMYDEVDSTTPTNNAPLQNGKGNILEGGIRVPLIAAWPGKIAQGKVSDTLAISTDIYPTFLDLLDLEPPSNQVIDGISIAPVLLRGESLDRDSFIIDFPHNVVATENRSSIAVRKGDMKLIRYYWDAKIPTGAKPEHRYELYDLSSDIGESKNLAADQADMVKVMDAMIEDYLEETGAVSPVPNPNFDAAAPPAVRGGGQANGPPRGERDPVAGWIPGGTCDLEVVDGMLVLTSKGNDPYLSCREGVPSATGKLEVRFTMSSNITGSGQLFWTSGKLKAFQAARSVEFDMKKGDDEHDYVVEIDIDDELTGVRIDPGRSPGKASIKSIGIYDASGTKLEEWTF